MRGFGNMRTYEIYTTKYSMIIQANSLFDAVKIFMERYGDEVIIAEDIEAKKLNKIAQANRNINTN